MHDLSSKLFVFIMIGPSNLTVDALRQHDRRDDEDEDDTQMLDDAQSVGGRTALTAATFSTWATNWTECTNRTFGRVHRYWASNSALHKEVGTVRDIIVF